MPHRNVDVVFRFALDSPLEGDGFGPSVPPVEAGRLCRTGGSEIDLALSGDRRFESISLQRGARCELDPPLDEDKRAAIGETIEMLTGNVEKIAEHGRRADGIVKSVHVRRLRLSALLVRR